MGMYTRIVHPEDGRELQIYTGFDELEQYSVGDEIPWKPNPRYPGQHVDGVYFGHGYPAGDGLVVIKNTKVVAVVDISDEEGQHAQEQRLFEEHDFLPPDPTLWSVEEWGEYTLRKKIASWESAQKLSSLRAQGYEGKRLLAKMMGDAIRARIDYASVARDTFKVEPLEGQP